MSLNYAHDDEVDATDAALKLAQENDIDLAQIEGTGSGGRVILSDVQSYLEEQQEDE